MIDLHEPVLVSQVWRYSQQPPARIHLLTVSTQAVAVAGASRQQLKHSHVFLKLRRLRLCAVGDSRRVPRGFPVRRLHRLKAGRAIVPIKSAVAVGTDVGASPFRAVSRASSRQLMERFQLRLFIGGQLWQRRGQVRGDQAYSIGCE